MTTEEIFPRNDYPLRAGTEMESPDGGGILQFTVFYQNPLSPFCEQKFGAQFSLHREDRHAVSVAMGPPYHEDRDLAGNMPWAVFSWYEDTSGDSAWRLIGEDDLVEFLSSDAVTNLENILADLMAADPIGAKWVQV